MLTLSLGLIATEALAQGPAVQLTDTLTVDRRTDNRNGDPNDDNYDMIVNRLNFNGKWGDFSSVNRLDSMYFIGAPTDEFKDDIRLERVGLKYAPGTYTLVAGDFYRQLGRGIALSLRKVDELGVDVSLRGGLAEYDGDVMKATVFGGYTNPANLDWVSLKFVEDSEDLIAGGEYTLRVGELFDFDRSIDLTMYYVYLQPRDPILDRPGLDDDQTQTVGGSLDVPELTDWLTFYGEVDYQQRRLVGDEEDGTAGFVALNVLQEHYGILFEGLYLDKYELRGGENTATQNRFNYNQPPTVERFDQEVLNNRDILGGRIRADLFLLDGDFVPYVNGMHRIVNPDEPGKVKQYHGYGGFEWRYRQGRARMNLAGGFRDEVQNGRSIKSLRHLDLDYLEPITRSLAFHMQLYHQFWELEGRKYARGSSLLAVEWTGVGSATVEVGHDTQNNSEGVRNSFLAGILVYNPIPEVQLRTIIGNQRGGIKCVAGVCRDFPEFSGLRFQVIARHNLGT
ncbi:MAG: DUF6029 family protein [Bradymonadia bacterium]